MGNAALHRRFHQLQPPVCGPVCELESKCVTHSSNTLLLCNSQMIWSQPAIATKAFFYGIVECFLYLYHAVRAQCRGPRLLEWHKHCSLCWRTPWWGGQVLTQSPHCHTSYAAVMLPSRSTQHCHLNIGLVGGVPLADTDDFWSGGSARLRNHHEIVVAIVVKATNKLDLTGAGHVHEWRWFDIVQGKRVSAGKQWDSLGECGQFLRDGWHSNIECWFSSGATRQEHQSGVARTGTCNWLVYGFWDFKILQGHFLAKAVIKVATGNQSVTVLIKHQGFVHTDLVCPFVLFTSWVAGIFQGACLALITGVRRAVQTICQRSCWDLFNWR